MDTLLWVILTVVFVIAELATVQLVSVWFAAGAFVTMLVSLLPVMNDGTLWIQAVIFVVLSAVAFFATLPLSRKLREKTGEKTNFDRIIGMTGTVTEEVDNLCPSGYVSVDGRDWMARTETDEEKIAAGSLVTVLRIEGAKIIVRKKD